LTRDKEEIDMRNDQSGNTNPDYTSFIIPSKDANGNTERLQCRITPSMARQMSIILASKFFPYRTQSDIIRHALNHLFHYLDELEPVPSITAQLDII